MPWTFALTHGVLGIIGWQEVDQCRWDFTCDDGWEWDWIRQASLFWLWWWFCMSELCLVLFLFIIIFWGRRVRCWHQDFVGWGYFCLVEMIHVSGWITRATIWQQGGGIQLCKLSLQMPHSFSLSHSIPWTDQLLFQYALVKIPSSWYGSSLWSTLIKWTNGWQKCHHHQGWKIHWLCKQYIQHFIFILIHSLTWYEMTFQCHSKTTPPANSSPPKEDLPNNSTSSPQCCLQICTLWHGYYPVGGCLCRQIGRWPFWIQAVGIRPHLPIYPSELVFPQKWNVVLNEMTCYVCHAQCRRGTGCKIVWSDTL